MARSSTLFRALAHLYGRHREWDRQGLWMKMGREISRRARGTGHFLFKRLLKTNIDPREDGPSFITFG